MGSRQSTPIPPPPSPELKKPWRAVEWRQQPQQQPVIGVRGKDEILHEVKEFKPSIEVLRIVLYGPTGAGKSSFINSVQRVLLGRHAMIALENSTFTGKSFTKLMKIHKMKKGRGEHYPFEIVDIMGLEPESGGIKPEDIINAFKGHILDEYTFNPVVAITDTNAKHRKNPTLRDKVHCLVSILPADSVSRMEKSVFEKMEKIRDEASLLGIPQVLVMTKVDKACVLVNEDLKKIYYSNKIKEKMNKCTDTTGISQNAIYPVKNYTEQITQDEDADMLILMALRDILNFADDYAELELEKEARS